MRHALAVATLSIVVIPGLAVAQQAETEVAAGIISEAYTGLWYEVARTPAPFQEQCDGGVTAFYQVIDAQSMRVVNRCDLPGGEAQQVEGTADVVDGNFDSFDVNFPQSPDDAGINYVIAAVGPMEDDAYSWAAVHSPDNGIGWILSRSVELGSDARRTAEDALMGVGVDVSRLMDTAQPPVNYDPGDA